jgi:hypothetical protein
MLDRAAGAARSAPAVLPYLQERAPASPARGVPGVAAHARTPDADLVAAWAAGNDGAFAELRGRYHARLIDVALSWLPPDDRAPDRAEEAVQQVWAALARRRSTLREWGRDPGVPLLKRLTADLEPLVRDLLKRPPARAARRKALPRAKARARYAMPNPQARAARATRESDTPTAARQALRRALAHLTDEERRLLVSQWQAQDRRTDALLRLLLPEEDVAPPPGQPWALAQAEAKLRRALADDRAMFRGLGPDGLWQCLSVEVWCPPRAADLTDVEAEVAERYRYAAEMPLSPIASSPRQRRKAEGEVYRRVSRSLFRLLEAVGVPLPAADEAGEATRLLRHLAGPEAVRHFYALHHGLREARARMDLAGDPSLYDALDRLLLWLTPECFVTTDKGAAYQLSFRLYLRARLKDYCRRKGWRPARKDGDLEAAFRALDRERIGEVVRDAVQEVVHAEAAAPAGVEPLQVLQWLKAAP